MALKPVELQLEVHGVYTPVDIDQSTAFAFTLQLTDITNPTSTKIPYSTTINIPQTKYNNDIFDNIWRIDHITLNFNTLIRTDFRLYVNNNLYQSGYVQLEKATLTNYQIRLYGGLGDYFYTLSDIKLTDLDFGTQFDHTIDAAFVYSSFIDTNVTINDIFKYVPTYQGYYDNFDSGYYVGDRVDGVVNSGEITWKYNNKQYLPGKDLTEHERTDVVGWSGTPYFGEYRSYYQKPMVKLNVIFDKIKEHMIGLGWETELDDSFFSSYNPYWNKVWMICPNYDADSDALVGGGSGTIDAKEGTLRYGDDIDVYDPVTLDSIQLDGSETVVSIDLLYKVYAVYTDSRDDRCAKGRTLTVQCDVYAGNNPVDSIPTEGRGISNNLEADPADKYRDATVCNKIPSAVGNRWYYTSTNNDGSARDPESYGFKSNADEYQTIYNFKGNATIPEGMTGEVTLRIRMIGDTRWKRRTSDYSNYRACSAAIHLQKGTHEWGSAGGSGTRSGSEITYKDIIRSDHSCLDFLMSYCKPFGLYFIKDPVRKKVSILTRNTYYGDMERRDWTDKIDYSKTYEVKPTPFDYKIGVFKWKDAETKCEVDYLSKTNREYGSARFDTRNQFSDDEKEYLEGGMFSNVIIASDYSQYYLGRSSTIYKDNKQLPHFQDNSGDGVDVGYSLVFYNGTRTTENNGGYWVTDDLDDMLVEGYCWSGTGNSYVASTYPDLRRTVTVGGDVYSLNFGSPSIVYNDDEADIVINNDLEGNSSLYYRFWATYLADRFSDSNKVLTCYVNLTNDDMHEDLFNKFIYVNDTPWVIDKIHQYNPLTTGTTKVDLVKVQNPQNYVSQRYVDGNFIVNYNGSTIYNYIDGPSNRPTTVLRTDGSARTITLQFVTDTSWRIINSGNLTVCPTSGNAGTTTVTVQIPVATSLTTNTIQVRWENTTTLLQIIQITSWSVTATATGGSGYVNGSSSVSVADNTVVNFTTTGNSGYSFGYWYINGQYYFDQTVSYTVTTDTDGQAYWYGGNQVMLKTTDANTTVTGQIKYPSDPYFWLLNSGTTYSFVNNQYNLSGYQCDDSELLNPINTWSHTIVSTDSWLYVYYDTLLANIHVDNSSNYTFNGSQIVITNPNSAVIPSPVGTVAAGTEDNISYMWATTLEGAYSFSMVQQTGYWITVTPSTINYTTGMNIPTVEILVENIGWAEDEIVVSQDGEAVLNTLYVPNNITYTLNINNTDVTANVMSGNDDAAILFTVAANTIGADREITVTANLSNGVAYTFTLVQAAQESFIEVSPITTVLGVNTSMYTINVTSNTSWSATVSSSLQPYIVATPLSGNGNTEVIVFVYANESVDEIGGTITFTTTDGNATAVHTLSQSGVVINDITISPTSAEIDTAGETYAVTVNSDVAWTATVSETSWVTVTPTSGNAGTTTVSITVTANTTGTPRTATVTFATNDGTSTATHTILQTVSATSEIRVSPRIVETTGTATLYEVQVWPDDAWTCVGHEYYSWLTVSPTSGTGQTSVLITVDANNTGSTRTAILTFTNDVGGGVDTHTLTQSANEISTLSIDPEYIELTTAANTYTIAVTSNTDWLVSTTADWVTLDTTSGTGSATITVTVPANDSGAIRQASIVFDTTDGNATATHTVAQKWDIGTLTVNLTNNLTSDIYTTTARISNDSGNLYMSVVLPNQLESGATSTTDIDLPAGTWIVEVNGLFTGGSVTPTDYTFTITNIGDTFTADFTIDADPYITPSTTSILFDYTASDQLITVNSNVNWTASGSTSWITVSPTTGSDGTLLRVSVSLHESAPNARVGYVYLSYNGVTMARISISHAPNPTVWVEASYLSDSIVLSAVILETYLSASTISIVSANTPVLVYGTTNGLQGIARMPYTGYITYVGNVGSSAAAGVILFSYRYRLSDNPM